MDVVAYISRNGSTPTPVMLDGHWGATDNIEYSTRYGDGFGGDDLFSCAFTPRHKNVVGNLRKRDKIEVWDGGTRVWCGGLSAVTPGDDSTVNIAGKGFAYVMLGLGAFSYDGSNYHPTSTLSTAFTTANDRFQLGDYITAIPWGDLPSTPHTAATDTVAMNMLGDLLTEVMRESGLRWMVNGQALELTSDPTTPTMRYRADQSVIGASDDDYAATVFVDYLSTAPVSGAVPTSSQISTVSSGDLATYNTEGDKHFLYDVVDQGLMTAVRAQNIADMMLDQVKHKAGITGSLDFADDGGLEAFGGGPVFISSVRAGRMLRVMEFRDDLTQLLPDASADIVIGQTTMREQEGRRTLTTAPMHATPQSLEQIVAATAPRVRANSKAAVVA